MEGGYAFVSLGEYLPLVVELEVFNGPCQVSTTRFLASHACNVSGRVGPVKDLGRAVAAQ